MEKDGGSPGERRRRRGLISRPRLREQQSWLLGCVALALLLACVPAVGQMSGRFGLDLIARRIPTTLTDEIALDTPSEFAMLEFGISSNLAIRADLGFADIKLDAAANMAGAEHAVGIVDLPLALPGDLIDDLRVIGEMWFAVPFEGITDVNNLPNCVVIPPGDPLFVAARLTTSFTCAGFRARALFMLQDVEFPNPASSFAPLYYRLTNQDFGLGSIFSTSWSSSLGASISLTLGFNASEASTVVKGYSASGRVGTGECETNLCNYFLNGSIGGIPLCDVGLGVGFLTDAQMSIAFHVATAEALSATAGFSAKLGGDMTVSTSISLFKSPHTSTGLRLTASLGCFEFGMALDKIELTSLSAHCGNEFNFGAVTGSYGLSATGLEKGLTGLSARLALSQGLFSASTSVAFAQRGADFGFASLGTQFSYRIPPGTLSIQATFSRYGMTRASLGAGVNF